jgi:2'-5' RNA ligase
MDTKRLFIGFLLNDDWNDAIQDFIDAQQSVRIKWIPDSNWHITVLFIGEFPISHLDELASHLGSLYRSIKPFGIPFDTFVYFPNLKKARMVWCKGAINQNFTNICEQTSATISGLCQKLNIDFQPEKRPEIIPHITLSRFHLDFPPSPLRIPNAHSFPMPLQLSEVHLFESKLQSSGAVYSKLKTFKLGK